MRSFSLIGREVRTMRINNVPNYCLVIPAAVLTAVLLLGWYFVQPIPFPALERCERVEVA